MSNSTTGLGRVLRGLPYSLQRHDPVSIGSDRGCEIVIEGADPHHAQLRWNAQDEAWFLHDDPAPGETRLNGEAIATTALRENDWFDIAGVRIQFTGGVLVELDPDKPVGLRLTLSHVSAKAGGKLRLDDVSLQVAEGALVALLGPSGCGKSTLIQRIAGLAPFDGEIRLNGHDIKVERESLLPLVAYLPQTVDDTFDGEMTVREVVEDFARRHLAADERPDFSTKLEDVDLAWSDVADKHVHLLSGGQKRRLALAIELLRDPQLLLLDEPTAGLDPAAESGIMELLRRLADQGRTVVCATHVLGNLDLCDEVAVLAPGGRLAFAGSPAAALGQFDATDWLAVYKKLESGKWSPAHGDEPCDPAPRAVPFAKAGASAMGAFAAILRRLVGTAFSMRNAWHFFGNPLGIAAALLLTCWPMFRKADKLGTVCFCMAVAMFWLGLSGSVRTLVAERVPRRCLDRMRGLSLRRYFWAHVTFVAQAVFVQSFLFSGVVFLLRHNDEFPMDAFPAFWGALALVGFAGGCTGLAVSAYTRTELQAVLTLPLIAIVVLFLSKPVLEYSHGEKPGQPLRAIGCAAPTIYAQTFLETELKKDTYEEEHARNRANFLWLILLAYPLALIPLAFHFQNKRESEWDGR